MQSLVRQSPRMNFNLEYISMEKLNEVKELKCNFKQNVGYIERKMFEYNRTFFMIFIVEKMLTPLFYTVSLNGRAFKCTFIPFNT